MEGDKTMQAFQSSVSSKLEEELGEIKTDVAAIKEMQKYMSSTPFPDKKDVGKYESLGEKVRLDATKIGASLKQLESKYDVKDLPDDSAFRQIRTQQLNTLTTKFNISTNEFFRVQSEYMDKMKTHLRRQLSAQGDAVVDDSKINAVFDEDSFSVFTDNYIADVNDLEQTLRDLEDRKKNMLALEKSVTDVNQLFNDLNLTHELKRTEIESEADNFFETGIRPLAKSGGHCNCGRLRRRKFCCKLIIIVLIVLVIIGIIITVSIVAA